MENWEFSVHTTRTGPHARFSLSKNHNKKISKRQVKLVYL